MTEPTKSKPARRGDWRIFHDGDAPPGHQYTFYHEDVKLEEGNTDPRFGYAATIKDAEARIHAHENPEPEPTEEDET